VKKAVILLFNVLLLLALVFPPKAFAQLGGSWSSPVTVLAEDDEIDDFAMDIDQNGDWHAVYDHDSDGIKYLNSVSGTPFIVETPGENVRVGSPGVAVDSNGNLHVMFTRFDYQTWQGSILYMNTVLCVWRLSDFPKCVTQITDSELDILVG